MKNIEDVLKCLNRDIEKGINEKLTEEQITTFIVNLIFKLNAVLPNKIIEIRDYDEIKSKGAFKYAGQIISLYEEGYLPQDIFLELKKIGIDRHFGPAYVRVKTLLTHQLIRLFFAKQMALKIKNYLKRKPPVKTEGYLICIPNMTGGAWIGDETRRQLDIMLTKYKVFSSTPYARRTRKPINITSSEEMLNDYIEGLMPTPEDSSIIFCFEELRNSSETTYNATNIYRAFGYTEDNNVRIIETCIFDYGHPVSIDRLSKLGVDRLFLVDGKKFFHAARKLNFLSDFHPGSTVIVTRKQENSNISGRYRLNEIQCSAYEIMGLNRLSGRVWES